VSKLGIANGEKPRRSSSTMKLYCMPVSLTVTIGTGAPRPTKPSPAPRITTCTFCAWMDGANCCMRATRELSTVDWHPERGEDELQVIAQLSAPATLAQGVPAAADVATPQSESPE